MSLYTWMIVGNFIFPFMNVLFPYLYWRQNRQTEDTAFTKEACNLLNFQILFSFINGKINNISCIRDIWFCGHLPCVRNCAHGIGDHHLQVNKLLI